MAIRGSLREASLPDVLQLLAMGKKTGCLSVTHRDQFGYIYFDRGRISYASIVNRRDRLGDVLLASALITPEDLDAAKTVQASDPDRRLGDILVAHGCITREELHGQIRIQIQEAVYFLFTWSHGTFSFDADARPEERDLLVSINPESLLLEGARRVDEWALITKRVPSFDLVFELDQERVRQSETALSPSQEAVAALIDGERDVTAIVDESGLGEFEVGKAMYALASAGFLRRIGRRAGGPAPIPDARIEEHRNLGVAFYKTGMLDEAAREFRRVADLRPGDSGALFYAGLVLMRQGQWMEAAEAFDEAASLPNARPAVFHNLAYVYERLGRYEDAEAALEQALARGAGTDPRVRTSYGVLALRRGDLAAAEAAFDAARPMWGRRAPSAAWYHYAALTAALAGDTERAVALLTEGIGHHPRAGALYNNLAAVHERRGRHAEAGTAIDRGMQEDPGLPQLHKNAGDQAYRAGQYDDALDAYQRAARLNGELGEDLFLKMGNIHYRRGERAEAVKQWERARELDPDNEIVLSNIQAARRVAAVGPERA
jgi:tetratricopeptide (TPR) repeat protein